MTHFPLDDSVFMELAEAPEGYRPSPETQLAFAQWYDQFPARKVSLRVGDGRKRTRPIYCEFQ